MSIIIERLASVASAGHGKNCESRTYSCVCGYDQELFLTCNDAADEIARLTEENRHLRHDNAHLKKENKRLRDAGDSFFEMAEEIARLNWSNVLRRACVDCKMNEECNRD